MAPKIKGQKVIAERYGVEPEAVKAWRAKGCPFRLPAWDIAVYTLENWLMKNEPAVWRSFAASGKAGQTPRQDPNVTDTRTKAGREQEALDRRPVLGSSGASPLPMTDGDFEDVEDETNWSNELKREQTIKLRRENAYREGRLLDRNAVEIAMNRIATTIRDRLVAIPRSLAPECENKKATIIEQLISREVREALVGLADIVGKLDAIAKDQE